MKNKLLDQYKKVYFKAFMIDIIDQPTQKDLQKLNNYNCKMQEIERQLNEQGINIR